jgi:hypothetical protein
MYKYRKKRRRIRYIPTPNAVSSEYLGGREGGEYVVDAQGKSFCGIRNIFYIPEDIDCETPWNNG